MPKLVLPIPDTPPITIEQQPKGDYSYVSNKANTVTQFGMSKDEGGALGYLAHNTKAGELFSKLKVGDTIGVLSEVPTTRGGYSKKVKDIRKFQALSPNSTNSAFVEIGTGKQYTADELYKEMYTNAGNLILQTCITQDGNDNWGRMFIVAGK